MALKAIAPELESGEWETFRRPRNFLGNKRVWLAGWNRSDHNDPICKKFPEIPERKDDYRVKSDWWNEHVVGRHDALAEASAISFVDEAWKSTPDGNRIGTYPRCRRFCEPYGQGRTGSTRNYSISSRPVLKPIILRIGYSNLCDLRCRRLRVLDTVCAQHTALLSV